VTVRTIESVWEYPRPPRVEPTVELETGHRPVYYVMFEAGMPEGRPSPPGVGS